jgi:hypothetical protein
LKYTESIDVAVVDQEMQIVFEGITVLRNAFLQSGYGEKDLSRSELELDDAGVTSC